MNPWQSLKGEKLRKKCGKTHEEIKRLPEIVYQENERKDNNQEMI